MMLAALGVFSQLGQVSTPPGMDPLPWPSVFAANFLSNISWSPGDDFKHTTSGTVYYGWTFNESQRIDHAAGSIECTKFYGSKKPCTLHTKPEGMYRIIEDPAPGQPQCCLDMAGISTPPPHWVKQGQPTWGGVVTITREDGNPNGWEGLAYRYPQTGNCTDMNQPPGTPRTTKDSGCHSYLQTTRSEFWDGRPLLFTFPANSGLQDWHFQPETERGASGVDASLFELPPGCAGSACPKSSAQLRAASPSWPTSYWMMG